MPRQPEPNANNALGNLLARMLPRRCTVLSENTQILSGHAGQHPDILITAPGRSPVVVEAEYEPASEVEQDARQRLGRAVDNEPRPIEVAIALRYPVSVENAYHLEPAVEEAGLSYAALYADGHRFPAKGWLSGFVNDLADLIQLVAVPEAAFDRATDILIAGIDTAVSVLENSTAVHLTSEISRVLSLADTLQTRRMAGAILANALIFHERIAGTDKTIRPLNEVCGQNVDNPKQATLDAWEKILKINYWPIFHMAKKIIALLPAREASQILKILKNAAESIQKTGLLYEHDLTGHVFQRLISDRKYLAAFYTLPASASLLARLAVAKINGVDWSDADAIGELRIADFACGTGALLSAVYEQITIRHEHAGKTPAKLHSAMMQKVLHGFDVMPSAVHITASSLSGKQPSVGYEESCLYTMPYGRQEDETVKIGSLEFLQNSKQSALFPTNDPAKRIGGTGEATADPSDAEVHNESLDLVIMNPPFTRATNHEGAHADVTNPAFAAFDASRDDQTAMGNRINELGQRHCYHGNAGIASAFAALANKKLKPGGILALVLPLSAASGLSWQDFRKMLADDYTDLTIVSIAANGRDMSFSSDTGMAECLVIARKKIPTRHSRASRNPKPSRVLFTSLRCRPQEFAHAAEIAKSIVHFNGVRQIEDGPYSGTNLTVGDDVAGAMLTAPQTDTNGNWGWSPHVGLLPCTGGLRPDPIPIVAAGPTGGIGIENGPVGQCRESGSAWT